jgi:hypothetical protein
MRPIPIILAIIILVIGCAHTPNTIQIQEKVSDCNDVDSFVIWLEEQPNIWNVNVNKTLFLTSYPPKVIVTYYQNCARYKLLLAVEPDHKLKLVKPE